MELDQSEKDLALKFFGGFKKSAKNWCENTFEYLDLDEIKSDLNNGNEVTLELEFAPRDLFYDSNTFLNWLKDAVAIDRETSALVNLTDLKCVFSSEDSTYDEEAYCLVYACEKEGLLVCIDGRMGEYCDDNYDAHAKIDFRFKSSPENTQKYVLNIVSNAFGDLARKIDEKISSVTRALPENIKPLAQEILITQLLQTNCFKPVLFEKSRQEITSHIDGLNMDKPQKKRKV